MPAAHPPRRPSPPPATWRERAAAARLVLRQAPGTVRLVWEADRTAVITVVGLTLLLGLLPAAVAWVGKLIVDAVVQAARSGLEGDVARVLWLVGGEAALLSVQLGLGRTVGQQREVLRWILGYALG